MRETKWAAIAVLAVALCMANSAASANAEAEPNNSCSSSQSMGKYPPAPMKGTVVAGDSDYFLLKAPAGAYLTLNAQGAESGKGTIQIPVIGAYNSSCTLLGGSKYNSKETVVVPADGILIIQVGDPYFSNSGNPIYLGSYVLNISTPSSLIFGTVTESQSGAVPVYTTPYLYRCANPDYQLCTNYITNTFLDASGRYGFDTSALEPGRYQVWIPGTTNVATQYSAVLDLSGAESIELNLQTKPTPIEITAVSVCGYALPVGSDCEMTYKVRNTTAEVQEIELRANLRIVTDASVLTSQYDAGKSGALTPINKTLQAGQTVKITQAIPIAASMPTGSSGFIMVYAYRKGLPQSAIGAIHLADYVISAQNTAMTTLPPPDPGQKPALIFNGRPFAEMQP